MFLIYSKPNCPQCEQAKSFLSNAGEQYITINLDVGQQKIPGEQYISRDELLEKIPTAKTMPQIFYIGGLNETYVGGFTELKKYNKDYL